jgi:hypothetical protein
MRPRTHDDGARFVRAAQKGRSLFGDDDDDRVFAGGDSSDLAGGDFDLSGRDDLVRTVDARNAPAHQLRRAQTRDYNELEGIRAMRSLNHETCFFLPADGLRAAIGETPVYPAGYSVNRYFSRTQSATMPSRHVIFLPSS